jgi:hypothetical protein
VPKIEFQERMTGEVKIRGQVQTGTPSSGGPHAFPPPPVPPPPPPVPLIIESIVGSDFHAAVTQWIVTFTEQPYMTECPNWVPDADAPTGEAVMQLSYPKSVAILCETGDSNNLTVPADATGVFSASGGKVTPGVYPLPYPPP